MNDQIFKEYDECETCQKIVIKNRNLPAVLIHLKDAHAQTDAALLWCARNEGYRRIFLELYNQTKPYHEPGFDKDLKLRFKDKAWEMITCRALLNSGRIVEPNIAQAGPDCTTAEAVIECINAGPAIDYVSKMNTTGELYFEEVPEEDIQLRITNAFSSKSSKLKSYLDLGIIDPAKARIIAINYSGAHDFAWADNDELSDNFVLKSLFGMGPLQKTVHGNQPSQEFKVSFQPELIKVTEIGDVKVPTDYFLTDAHRHISAVIFSNHQIQSDQSEDVSIVNNPFTEVPITIEDYSDMNRILADTGAKSLTKTPRIKLS